MTEPLAILLYEELLPGSQLTNRLRDLGYRVQTIADPETLLDQVAQEKPLLAVVDLSSSRTDMCAHIGRLKSDPTTAYLPVLAFSGQKDRKLQEAARAAGANLVASKEGILAQLPMLLEQVLQVD